MHRTLVLFCMAVVASALCVHAGAPGGIQLRTGTIDTNKEPAFRMEETRDMAPEQRLQFYVQFAGKVTEDAKTQVEQAAQTKLKDYLPVNTFVISTTPAGAAAVQQLAAVHWVGRVRAEHKLSPELVNAAGGSGTLKLKVRLVDDGARTREQVAALAAKWLSRMTEAKLGATAQAGSARYVMVECEARDIKRVAQWVAEQPEVSWVEQKRAMGFGGGAGAGVSMGVHRGGVDPMRALRNVGVQ